MLDEYKGPPSWFEVIFLLTVGIPTTIFAIGMLGILLYTILLGRF